METGGVLYAAEYEEGVVDGVEYTEVSESVLAGHSVLFAQFDFVSSLFFFFILSLFFSLE
jgi:hypothetical protein